MNENLNDNRNEPSISTAIVETQQQPQQPLPTTSTSNNDIASSLNDATNLIGKTPTFQQIRVNSKNILYLL